jgi:hypothetical protein
MDTDSTTLKQKLIIVLTQRGEPMGYRELTDTVWASYPEYREHMVSMYETEKKARVEQRIRMGGVVKGAPGVFTATKSDGIVLVGLAASEADVAEEADDEEIGDESAVVPSVYWYTFPAYRKLDGAYPIKVGRGTNPRMRISQQVTAMPEQPIILGSFEHADNSNLERALHAVLELRGKRKQDSPGAEWFITTPEEIIALIQVVLGTNGG